MLRLLLIRHGETEWNSKRRFQGHSDILLNERGKEQVAALGKCLADTHITAIYASDLQRAWHTAEAISNAHATPLPIQAEPRLREINFGTWEGLTYQQVEQIEPERLRRYYQDSEVAPPKGESLAQLTARVKSVLDEITTHHADGTIILASHGGTLRVGLSLLLKLPLEAWWRFKIKNASICELHIWQQGQSAVLVRLNDGCHLRDTSDYAG